MAWKSNKDNPERWKILDRLARSGILTEATPFEYVLESTVEREWEYYFGHILSCDDVRQRWMFEFRDLFDRIDHTLDKRLGPSWSHVHKLWSILRSNAPYVPGVV